MTRTTTSYIAFQTDADPALTVAGVFTLPWPSTAVAKRSPAVLICHGSAGVDGRGVFHAGHLHRAGVATLEIDMWAARGATRGPAARPASPLDTLPDAFAARDFLAEQPEADPTRIGVMGFSWGGVVSLLTARRGKAGERRFAAHVALYPVCWLYRRIPALSLSELTGAPILILTGETDAYDAPGAGPALAQSLQAASGSVVRAIAYADAGHGFDRDLPSETITDPFAHGGKGGPVVMAFQAKAARAARAEIVRFFRQTLG